MTAPATSALATLRALREEQDRLHAALPALEQAANQARKTLEGLGRVQNPHAREVMKQDAAAAIGAFEAAAGRFREIPTERRAFEIAHQRAEARARAVEPPSEPPALAALARQAARALDQFADALARAIPGES